jgi:Lrp/AsnC family leucine-responsive transcriptional regulator
MLDRTDWEILELLRGNSRLQWREIGDRVHLTGQAVANRIRRMEEMGIIKAFSVVVDETKLGRSVFAYVTVSMKSTDHAGLQRFVRGHPAVSKAHRISGDTCYILQVGVGSMTELNDFLDELLRFGNYRLNLAIGELK